MKSLFSERNFLILLLLLVIFLITRFWGILNFPIFNDESIYLEYSQLINENPERYWFISIDNVFRDFKPPLQYWLGSFFMDVFDNPLLSGRFLSVIFSILGLIGIYFFVLNLYGKKEAIFAALFFTFSPYILMYNTQFTAETYIFSTAAFLYLFGLQLVQSPFDKVRWGSFLGLIICGTALLLFKQSGALYLYLLVFILLLLLELPFLLNKKKENPQYSIKKWQFLIASLIIGAIMLSFLYYNLVIPLPLAIEERGFSIQWLMSLGEILTFPTDIWLSNAKIVLDLYRHSYGLVVIPLIIGFIVFAFYRANLKDIVISLLFIVSSAVIIFWLRGFNEYIYNTTVIIFLITILGRAASLFWEKLDFNSERAAKSIKIFTAIFLLITVSQWSYQLILMKTQPVNYFEKNSSWAKGAYLTSWASGYGVKAVVDFLKEQEGPAIAFVDPQWGNPGTSLRVFNKYYPQIKLFSISDDTLNPQFMDSIKKDQTLKNRFMIFSRSFREWESYLIANFCSQMLNFKEYEYQTPIVVCRF